MARHEFYHVGVFTFSPEEGTAAITLPNPVPEAVMGDRRDQLMALQQPISARKNQACLGKTLDVLIEQENPSTGELIGRATRFAPDVDGLVYVKGTASLNQIVPVTITATYIYDLYGMVAEEAAVF